MPISGKEAVKRLQNLGFIVSRQRGSHVVLIANKNNRKYVTVVPLHKELKRGTLRSIAKLADISLSELE